MNLEITKEDVSERITQVPKRGKGKMRGNGMGQPGYFHDPVIHNALEHNH